jgi:hypothetical protein
MTGLKRATLFGLAAMLAAGSAAVIGIRLSNMPARGNVGNTAPAGRPTPPERLASPLASSDKIYMTKEAAEARAIKAGGDSNARVEKSEVMSYADARRITHSSNLTVGNDRRVWYVVLTGHFRLRGPPSIRSFEVTRIWFLIDAISSELVTRGT